MGSYSGFRVAGTPVVHTGAVAAAPAVVSSYAAYPTYSNYGYANYGYPHYIGKVALGIPQAKAAAEGRLGLSAFTHTSYSGHHVAGAPVFGAYRAPVAYAAAYPSAYGYGLPYYG